MNKKDFGAALKAAREAKGWKRMDLAWHTNTTVTTIARYETGIQFPDIDRTMPKICEALGVEFKFHLVTLNK